MSLKEIIMLSTKDYFDTVLDVHVNIILFIIAFALCAASFVINHHKTLSVQIIKQLLRREALDEDKAKTLSELRLADSGAVKRALTRKGQLTDIVKEAGKEQLSYEQYVALEKEKKLPGNDIDFSTARFYIPREKLGKARKITEIEHPSVLRTVLVCLLILAVAVCIALLMPEILTLLSNQK